MDSMLAAIVAACMISACTATITPKSDGATPPPARRFYIAQYNAAGYPQYPNCSVATYTNFQSAAFRDQYNADGFMYRLGPLHDSLSCSVAVMHHRGSPQPTALGYERGTITLFGRDGSQLCNGPYNATMALGVSQNNNYNAAAFASITQAMQDSIQPNAAFGYSGSTAILDCATPPAPTPSPSATTYYVAPFQAGGYAATGFPQCQVATLAQFQSDEFRQQYNRGGGPFGGGLDWLADLPAYLSCSLTVVPYPGGAPGSLGFERGSISVFGIDTGSPLCNGPYNATMRIGTTQNNNYNPAIFSTLTPWMQAQASIGGFTYTGVLALVACGPTPVPTPPPLPAARRFRIASYDSSGYPSDANCSVATLAAFMSDAFREQYNVDGVLPFEGPISNWVSCNMAILSHPGGQIATLGWQRGAIVPFSKTTGAELCNGPYEASMKIGASQDNNYNAAIFDSITAGMQNGATLNPFVYTGSLTLLDCDPAASPPTPAPAPVTLNRFVLGAYEPTGAYANNCALATLEAYQSPAFRRQYNLEHALQRFGVVPNSYSCHVAVAQYAGGPPAILSFQRGSIVAFGRDGAELCNGPYNSTMKIGTSQDNNYNAQLFDSMTEALQQQTGLGSFSSNTTLALVDCGTGAA